MTPDQILRLARPILTKGGFDLLSTCSVADYNEHPQIIGLGVEQKLRGDGDDLVVLVGNSSALWGPFIQFLADNADEMERARPDWLDHYTRHLVGQATTALTGSDCASPQTVFAFETIETHQRCISVNTVAHVSGMALYLPELFRSVHAELGPWIGYRAVMVFPGCKAPSEPAVLVSSDIVSPDEIGRVKAVQGEVMANWGKVPEAESWKGLVAVSDTFDLGRSQRYCEDQVSFHYSSSDEERDAVLKAAVAQYQRS